MTLATEKSQMIGIRNWRNMPGESKQESMFEKPRRPGYLDDDIGK